MRIPIFNPNFYKDCLGASFVYEATYIDSFLRDAHRPQTNLETIGLVANFILTKIEWTVSDAISFVIRPYLSQKLIAKSFVINILSYKAIHDVANHTVPITPIQTQSTPRNT